jgi:hypothetical protein
METLHVRTLPELEVKGQVVLALILASSALPLCVHPVLHFQVVVMDWLEQKLVDENAMSMGGVWQCVSELMQSVVALRNFTGALGTMAEKNSNTRVIKWARDVCLVCTVSFNSCTLPKQTFHVVNPFL